MTAAALGLSAILSYSATAFTAIKWVGGLYLLYLAWSTLRSKEKHRTPSKTDRYAGAMSRLFWQGVITNVLNPKVAVFFLAFLPQFVDASRGSVIVQTLFLGSYFIVQGTIVTAMVGLAFGAAGA